MQDPNCSGYFLYRLVTTLQDSDTHLESETSKVTVTPLCNDQRPEAIALFQELSLAYYQYALMFYILLIRTLHYACV